MTEREQLEYEETRILVFNMAGGKCEVCGAPLEYTTFQLAHRIPQRKHFVKKYGKEVIHHEFNLAATCGLKCNNAVSIGGKPTAVESLATSIREEIDAEKRR